MLLRTPQCRTSASDDDELAQGVVAVDETALDPVLTS